MFSIVTPVYNVGPYLRQCLCSIRAQTYGEWEAICVDDGSMDESAAILDEYAAKDGRFRVIHRKNRGVSVARNAGLDVAKGEYVCFVDPDDVLHTNWLANFHEQIVSCSPDVVVAGYETFSETYDLNKSYDESVARSIDKNDLIKHFLVDGRCFVFAVRRSMVSDVRFVPGIRLSEDVLFSVEVASKVISVMSTSFRGYGYRQRPGALTKVRLESAERLIFLNAVLARGPIFGCVDASLMIWQQIQYWLVNAADYDRSLEIRNVLRTLRRRGLVHFSSLPKPSVPAALLFYELPNFPRLSRFVLCSVWFVFGSKRQISSLLGRLLQMISRLCGKLRRL